MNRAVFINKDGILIPDIPNNADPDKINLAEGAAEGLAMLKRRKYLLIVISSEPGIAHGYFPENAMINVQRKILQLLKPYHISLNGFYYCPHHPQGAVKDYSVNCFCRKPQPGLLLRAAKDFNIDLSQSWMIADLLNDIEAGKRAGCKTLLINNGSETEWLITDNRMPDFELAHFKHAASFITNGNGQYSINRNNAEKRRSV
jgi:D,D-heptose 1,7-bisphosphate phosphatase